MAIIIFGNRKTTEYNELEKTLGKKARDLDSDTKALWKALKQSEEEKKQLLKRLENLETIVTSDTWEAVKAGEDQKHIELTLEDEEPEELNDADKAERIAKRVR